MSFSERLRIAGLAAERSRRAMVSRMLYARPLRWRLASPAVSGLLIVPQDLRTADPSFWHEIELGQFGLAGTLVELGDRSPFEIAPPNRAWARELHSFNWLRHLEAASSDAAKETAVRLAVEWAIRHRGGAGVAWEPAVLARRIISWMSHATFLLEETDARLYDAIGHSLGRQIVRLGANWRDTPSGEIRLLGLTALLMAELCVAGHEHRIASTRRALIAELEKEILPDGGHVCRDPGVLVELVLDLLPLRQCFVTRGRETPPELSAAIQRAITMLRFMRLGDGMLARFNGVSAPSLAGLATVLGYDENPDKVGHHAPHSRYVRLERDRTVVVADAGGPPPLKSASRAHAGCLSFELSSENKPIVVNCGAPSPADIDWHPAARATASHSTLCLGEQSSSRLARHPVLEDLFGTAPISGPLNVEGRIEEHGGAIEFYGLHDGYLDRFGLVHRRSLVLHETGRRLLGIDRIEGRRAKVRLRQDIPLAIHFHLHPEIACRSDASSGVADIDVADGQKWRLSIEGARLSIEESTYFADSSGPRHSLQIVARNATFGETEIRWVLERYE